MYDELWQEIADAPGEIFDIPELQDEKFDEKFDSEVQDLACQIVVSNFTQLLK